MVPDQNQNETNVSNRLEVLYDGYYYDVTDFARKHPGGNIISYYTEKGEDATQAILQFHNRSISKIKHILKSFKRRPAKDEEYNLDPLKLARHRAMTDDFAKLFLEIQNEGLFKPSYLHIAVRAVECLIWWVIAAYFAVSSSILSKVFGSALYAVGCGRASWLGHEGRHNSLTGKPKVDRFLSSFFLGVFVGLSSGWWSRGHNKHHAMPQRLNHDVDLNTMPFMAYNTKVVKDPKQGNTFFIRNQAWLFLSVNCFLGYCAWRFVISPRNAWKRGNYMDLLWIAVHYYINYVLIQDFLQGFLIFWFTTNHMFGNFALSHSHLPITEEHTHWIEYGLIHTANIKSNWLVDWWMGYLNFQIEHHLFPTLPQFRCHLVKDRVEALAKKYGLPYYNYSYKEACIRTLKNFHEVAQEFKHL